MKLFALLNYCARAGFSAVIDGDRNIATLYRPDGQVVTRVALNK